MLTTELPTNVDADIAPGIDPATVRAVALVEETGEVLVGVEALENRGGGSRGGYFLLCLCCYHYEWSLMLMTMRKNSKKTSERMHNRTNK
jgi:hypothetical protein